MKIEYDQHSTKMWKKHANSPKLTTKLINCQISLLLPKMISERKKSRVGETQKNRKWCFFYPPVLNILIKFLRKNWLTLFIVPLFNFFHYKTEPKTDHIPYTCFLRVWNSQSLNMPPPKGIERVWAGKKTGGNDGKNWVLSHHFRFPSFLYGVFQLFGFPDGTALSTVSCPAELVSKRDFQKEKIFFHCFTMKMARFSVKVQKMSFRKKIHHHPPAWQLKNKTLGRSHRAEQACKCKGWRTGLCFWLGGLGACP